MYKIKIGGGIFRDRQLRRKTELAEKFATTGPCCRPQGGGTGCGNPNCGVHNGRPTAYGREPRPLRGGSGNFNLSAEDMTDDMLRQIDSEFDGVVIVDSETGGILDPGSVTHDVYRLHQVDLGKIALDKRYPGNIYKLIKDVQPIERVPPGETGSISNLRNAPNQPGKPPRSDYWVYDTEKLYGVNLAVVLDERSGRIITVIPTTAKLETKKKARHSEDRKTNNIGRASREGREEARETIITTKSGKKQPPFVQVPETDILSTDDVRSMR